MKTIFVKNNQFSFQGSTNAVVLEFFAAIPDTVEIINPQSQNRFDYAVLCGIRAIIARFFVSIASSTDDVTHYRLKSGLLVAWETVIDSLDADIERLRKLIIEVEPWIRGL